MVGVAKRIDGLRGWVVADSINKSLAFVLAVQTECIVLGCTERRESMSQVVAVAASVPARFIPDDIGQAAAEFVRYETQSGNSFIPEPKWLPKWNPEKFYAYDDDLPKLTKDNPIDIGAGYEDPAPTINSDDVGECYFFGCKGEPGHYLYMQAGRVIRNADALFPFQWTILDAGLLPQGGDQTEGAAALVRFNGWTVVSFWDRSVDERRGCNSSFVVPGEWSFDQVIAISKIRFPWFWERVKFEVRLVY